MYPSHHPVQEDQGRLVGQLHPAVQADPRGQELLAVQAILEHQSVLWHLFLQQLQSVLVGLDHQLAQVFQDDLLLQDLQQVLALRGRLCHLVLP